jgi:hypothetical protein
VREEGACPQSTANIGNKLKNNDEIFQSELCHDKHLLKCGSGLSTPIMDAANKRKMLPKRSHPLDSHQNKQYNKTT